MVGAALSKPGRTSTARWCGFGVRDEEEYARNQRDYVPQRLTGSNLVDMGRVRCAPAPDCRGGELLGGHVDVGSGGHGEVLRGRRGDAAGTELGSSFVERVVSEHGNRSGPHPRLRDQRGSVGWAHRRPIGPGRGGAAVVVGGRESRSQGEGRQR